MGWIFINPFGPISFYWESFGSWKMAMVNLIKILQCLTHQQSNRNSIQSKGFQGVSTQNKIRFPTFFVVVFFLHSLTTILWQFCNDFQHLQGTWNDETRYGTKGKPPLDPACGAGSEGAMGFRAAWDAAIGLPMGLKGYGYRIPKGFYLSELWD